MTKQFRLYITTDNAAFSVDPRYELANILRATATRLERGDDDFHYYQTLRDINGNDVGRAGLKPIEEELHLPGRTVPTEQPLCPAFSSTPTPCLLSEEECQEQHRHA